MDTGRILWGLILVGLGGVLLAGQLDLLDAGEVIALWWPVLVIVAGLLRLVQRPPDVTGAVVLGVLGLLLLGWRHDLFDLSIVIPLLLIAAGLWVLLRRGRRRPGAVDASTIEVVAVLGGRDVRVTSTPFHGGRVVATLGAAEVDLRDATLPPEGADLEVVAVLGGAELKLPAGWDVRVSGPALLGAVEEKTLAAEEGAPVLNVRATAVLGGIELTTDPRRSVPRDA